MPVRRWLVIAGIVVAGAALTAALAPTTVLRIENAATGRTVRVAVHGDRFAVTYQHSMYDQPVTEEFAPGPDAIRLLSVSSPSAAVLEYFGITAVGQRHAVDRSFHELVFRVAAGPEQTLDTGSVKRSFLDFGAHGDRLVLRVGHATALGLLLDRSTLW